MGPDRASARPPTTSRIRCIDRIRFEVVDGYSELADGPVKEAEVFVNGRNLRELAREVESPYAAREGKAGLAGSYSGLPPKAVFLPSCRLLGEPETYYDHDGLGRLAVLGCVCGVVGCWPLLVEIWVLEDRVIWRNFKQPHRSAWRHDRMGSFVFDLFRYLDELRGPKPAPEPRT